MASLPQYVSNKVSKTSTWSDMHPLLSQHHPALDSLPPDRRRYRHIPPRLPDLALTAADDMVRNASMIASLDRTVPLIADADTSSPA
jgi:hypothetical protein